MSGDKFCDTHKEKYWTSDGCDQCCLESDEVPTRAELIEVIKVLRQTVMEVRHAQQRGSWWYTNGPEGLYRQVNLWLNKSDKAIASIEVALNE